MTWLLPTLGGHSLVLSPTHTGTRSVIIGSLGLEPYFSMVFLLQETLGWCNGKIRQRYFKFEYLIISSFLSALEDTSWALRSVIQIWMKTFSFNSSIYIIQFMWTYLTIYDIFITSCENKDCRNLTCYNYFPIHLLWVIDYGKTTIKTFLKTFPWLSTSLSW